MTVFFFLVVVQVKDRFCTLLSQQVTELQRKLNSLHASQTDGTDPGPTVAPAPQVRMCVCALCTYAYNLQICVCTVMYSVCVCPTLGCMRLLLIFTYGCD